MRLPGWARPELPHGAALIDGLHLHMISFYRKSESCKQASITEPLSACGLRIAPWGVVPILIEALSPLDCVARLCDENTERAKHSRSCHCRAADRQIRDRVSPCTGPANAAGLCAPEVAALAPAPSCRKGLLHRPARSESPFHSSTRDAEACSPSGERERFVLERYELCLTLVVGLLYVRCPSAVSGLVIAEGIDSLQRSSQRARTHIFGERLVFLPPVADRHAFGAVEPITIVARVLATGTHRAPHGIDGALGLAMFRSVLLAAARASLATVQSAVYLDRFTAAIAPATIGTSYPLADLLCALDSRHDERPKPSANNVYMLRHVLYRTLFTLHCVPTADDEARVRQEGAPGRLAGVVD
jgi:hypothetical protein